MKSILFAATALVLAAGPAFAQSAGPQPAPLPAGEVLVQEGLHFYYQRDAEGLARWIRRRVAA